MYLKYGSGYALKKLTNMDIGQPFLPKVIIEKFYYGWIIVAMAGIGLLFSGPGQTYSISAFIDSYIEHFGWSRSQVSAVYSIATLIAGFLLFIIGRLIDKYGHRKMSMMIGVLLGCACMFSSYVTTPLMLFIGFFSLRLFGQGSMTLLPSTLVPQWFAQKRARALSIMALGGVVGSAVIPPLNTYMIDYWGWNSAWRFWAIMLWVVFVPIAFAFIRNKPEDIGMRIDNKKVHQQKSTEANKDTIKDSNKKEEKSWTLREAMGTRAFWVIMFCQAVPAMINTGIVFHLVSILGQKGLEHTVAALVLSTVAIVGFPVTFIAGYVLDRIKVHYVMAVVFLIEFISILILLYSSSLYMAYVFGILIGMLSGMMAVCNNVIWPNYFGRKHLGSIKGFSMTSMVLGSALGPLPFGFAFDMFGGYAKILMLMSIFPILAIIGAISSPAPVFKDE